MPRITFEPVLPSCLYDVMTLATFGGPRGYLVFKVYHSHNGRNTSTRLTFLLKRQTPERLPRVSRGPRG